MSVLSGTVPIHLKLHTMKIDPLEEQTQRSTWEFAVYVGGRDVDDDLGSLASGVDVWGIVIAVVHEHDNTIKATDDGHICDDGVEGRHHRRQAPRAVPGLEETSRGWSSC